MDIITENKRWFDLYNYDKNEDSINKIFKRFDINNYHAIWDGFCTSVIVEYKLKIYKLELREDTMEMNIYRKEVRRRGQKSTKEYMPLKKNGIHNDPWYNSCKWIIENSEL